MKSVESKFVAILEELKRQATPKIKKLDGYKFIEKCIASEVSMFQYFNHKFNDIRYVQDQIDGNVILDAGCGSGAFSVILSLMGAKKVYAVDYLEDCVQMADFLVKIAGLNNIEVIHSDIGELNLPEKSVDGILSIEAISHYRNYKSFLNMASKVLRNDGFLVIRDGNNGASPRIRKMTYKIWDMYENNPNAISALGHSKGEGCYLDMRKNIIKEKFPDLSQSQIDEFAKYTFAYSKEKIIKVVDEFLCENFSSKSEYSYGQGCPLDPETDMYMEYLLHPKKLKNEMKDYGFKSIIKSNGPARRKLRLLRYFWELFSPITIYAPRGFQLIATKKY